MNVFFRHSEFQSWIQLIHFWYGPNTFQFTLRRRVALQINDDPLSRSAGCIYVPSLKWRRNHLSYACVNRNPIKYGFRIGARAFRWYAITNHVIELPVSFFYSKNSIQSRPFLYNRSSIHVGQRSLVIYLYPPDSPSWYWRTNIIFFLGRYE